MSDNEAKEKLVDLVVENVKDKRLRNELLYYIFNGHTMDRDIHAAQNVKLFGSTKRAECLEQASVETLASTIGSNTDCKLSRRNENENSTIHGGVSSLQNIVTKLFRA